MSVSTLCRILHTHGPAGGLRGAEINARTGGSVSAVAVEDQVAGLEMDGILEFLRSRLVGRGHAGGVGFQIDLHFTSRGNVAGFRIEGEVVAIDLIEAGGVAAVKDDADIVQFGTAVELEFFNVSGADGKDRASGFGLGKLKAAGGLLDVVGDLSGESFEDAMLLQTGIEDTFPPPPR